MSGMSYFLNINFVLWDFNFIRGADGRCVMLGDSFAHIWGCSSVTVVPYSAAAWRTSYTACLLSPSLCITFTVSLLCQMGRGTHVRYIKYMLTSTPHRNT